MTYFVLGHDAAWGGWGQCLATEDGPVWVHHVKLGSRKWRWDVMRTELLRLEDALADGPPFILEEDTFRVVVEKPPLKMPRQRRGARGQKPHSPASIYPMGALIGSILLWGTRPGWLYPWEILIKQEFDKRTRQRKGDVGWRDFWNIGKQPDRARYKIAAMYEVDRMGWGSFLEPYGWRKNANLGELLKLAEKPCADVAEAILIAVGCAMRPELGPKGPAKGIQ